MNLGGKLQNLSNDMKMGAKKATHSLTHILFRLVSGFFLGLVLALIVQEMTQSGTMTLVFLTTVLTASVYKALSRLSLPQILIFDLICVLIATVLNMYIKIAP